MLCLPPASSLLDGHALHGSAVEKLHELWIPVSAGARLVSELGSALEAVCDDVADGVVDTRTRQ